MSKLPIGPFAGFGHFPPAKRMGPAEFARVSGTPPISVPPAVSHWGRRRATVAMPNFVLLDTTDLWPASCRLASGARGR